MTNFTTTEDLEKEAILNTIKDFVEETTIYTLSDEQMTMKNFEIEETDLKLSLPEDINEEDITTVFPEEELTTTRRLPERYMRTRTRPPMTTPAPPKIINHNMNLQTALIINTLSKVTLNACTVYCTPVHFIKIISTNNSTGFTKRSTIQTKKSTSA